MSGPLPVHRISNALTIDVEDYFQVSAFAPHIDRGDWERMPCRIERNVDQLLHLLSDSEAEGYFLHAGMGGGALSAAGTRHRLEWTRARKPWLWSLARFGSIRRGVRGRHPPREGGAGRHGWCHRTWLSRAQFLDRPEQSVGVRQSGRGRLPSTARACIRCSTITMECLRRRAFRFACAIGCSSCTGSRPRPGCRMPTDCSRPIEKLGARG